MGRRNDDYVVTNETGLPSRNATEVVTSDHRGSTVGLSILLLCWNHVRFLEDCIGSIVRQGPQDFEIIFLDNVSIDGSFELARALFDRFGLTATMIRNETPLSISANLNQLLRESHGSIVALLSTDDFYAPDYVAEMRAAATAHPAAGWFSCGGWHLQQETGERTQIDTRIFDSRRDIRAELLAGREPFFFVGLCYRRSALVSVNGWDENIPIEDADLFFRLAGKFAHHAITKPLVIYRKHGGGASADPNFMVDALEKFYAKHRAAFPGRLLNDHRSNMMRTYAGLHADRGEGRAAVRLSLRALAMRPTQLKQWRTLIYALRTAAKGARTP